MGTKKKLLISLWFVNGISRQSLTTSWTLLSVQHANCHARRRATTSQPRNFLEFCRRDFSPRGHQGGTLARRVKSDKDAGSVGGSHSVRKQSSTTTGADWRWLWRDTVVPLSSCHWVACSSSGSQVARRLPGRHSSVAASPLRCRTGLSVGRHCSSPPGPRQVNRPSGKKLA